MATWEPPEHFRELASAVPGISVWGPVEREVSSDLARCPGCGAWRSWSPELQALACPHCGDEEAPEAEPAAAPSERGFTERALSSAPSGWGAPQDGLSCTSCGAELALSEGETCKQCPFCASVAIELHDHPPDALRPGFVTPLSVERAKAEELLRGWLKRGWMHPEELGRRAIVRRVEPVYLPLWSFSTKIRSDWSALVGTDHHRWVPDGKGGQRRETTTTWAHRTGHLDQELDDHLVWATTRVTQSLLDQLLPRVWLPHLEPYDPRFLAGCQALAYDVPLETAWTQGRKHFREEARRGCRADTRGDHVRDLEVDADLWDERWKLLLAPVWVAAYRYDDRTWQVLVDGRTGRIVGHRPVVWKRVKVAIGVVMVASLPTLIGGPLGVICILVAAALSYWIWRTAKKAEGA